jgi:hypothetical protein
MEQVNTFMYDVGATNLWCDKFTIIFSKDYESPLIVAQPNTVGLDITNDLMSMASTLYLPTAERSAGFCCALLCPSIPPQQLRENLDLLTAWH